jgi:hypothetical protein
MRGRTSLLRIRWVRSPEDELTRQTQHGLGAFGITLKPIPLSDTQAK